MFISEIINEVEVTKVAPGVKAGKVSTKKSNAADRAQKHYKEVVKIMTDAKKDGTFVKSMADNVRKARAAMKTANLVAGAQSAVSGQARTENREAKQAKWEEKNGKPQAGGDPEVNDAIKATEERAAKQKEERAEKAKNDAKKSNAKSTNESAKLSPLSRFLAEVAQKPKAPLGERGKAVNAKASAAKSQNTAAEALYNRINQLSKKIDGGNASDADEAALTAAQAKLKNMKSADTKTPVKGKPQEKQEARQAKQAVTAKKEEEHEAAMTGPADD